MKYSNKLYEYEIKGQEKENNLINEKINYTTKNYFYIVNNFSKEISRIEDEINIYNQNNPININELIYNQHFIIKELISKINKIGKNYTENKFDNSDRYDESIIFENKNEFNNNKIENNVISFTIFSSYNRNLQKNNIYFLAPSPVYRKKITLNLNSSSRINTSYSKNDFKKNSLEKKIINSLSTYDNDYSLKIQNNRNIKIAPMSMVEKIKKENNYKINKFNNNIPSKESYKSLRYKLQYKCYKPSFLNSFVSSKKKKNRSQIIKSIKSSAELLSTNRCSFEKKIKNKNNKSISLFNLANTNTIDSKINGIKRVKSTEANKNNKINLSKTFYNLKIIDDSYVNNYLDRTNTESRPKANKYVKNLYAISNKIVDKFHKKILDD